MTKGEWESDMYDILVSTGYGDHYHNKEKVDISFVKDIIFQQVKDRWAVDIWCKSKLRTYCEIKHVYGPECVVKFIKKETVIVCSN